MTAQQYQTADEEVDGYASQTDSQTDSSEDAAPRKEGGVAGRMLTRWKSDNMGLELLCGITVALALVPEAVAFALAAGLTPSIGLHSAWVIAFVTAILGGRPAMICGATGSLAVLIQDGLHGNPVEYLFVAVILMGFIEIVLGLLQVGSLVKLIPAPVMIGFCNGLALVIGLAQFSNYHDVEKMKAMQSAAVEGGARRLGAFDAFKEGSVFIQGEEAVFAGIVTAVAFSVCMFLPKLTKKVPSALIAIIMGTVIEWAVVRAAFSSATPLVGDIAALHGSLPSIAWFDNRYTMPPLNWHTLSEVARLSITMAAVGLLESLMTLNLVDEITDTKGDTRRECIGQGVANVICGALGGMGGCAMIGQSMINVGSGARSRLSSATAGVVLLLIVMVFYSGINCIPVSALVGVMFNVVFHTFEWSSLKLMLLAALPQTMREKMFNEKRSRQKIRRADAFVILAVTLVTLFTDLATAVAVGMVFACFMFAYDTANLVTANTREERDATTGKVVKYYEVHGVLFFGSCSQFLSLFEEKTDPDDVRLVFETGYIADYSAIEALNKVGERYGAAQRMDGSYGKTVTIQQLKEGCGKIVEKSSGLLVKELIVSVESEEVLPAEREHLNVEHKDDTEHLMQREVSQGSQGSLRHVVHDHHEEV